MNIATFIRYAVCIYNRYDMQKNNLVHQLESSTYVCNNPIFIKQYLDKEPNSFRNCYNLKYVKICLQHLYIPKIRHTMHFTYSWNFWWYATVAQNSVFMQLPVQKRSSPWSTSYRVHSFTFDVEFMYIYSKFLYFL